MPIGEGGIFQPSAAKWNILGTNDASFNNGTGLPVGSCVQFVYNNSSAVATGTTAAVLDDTIPQTSEGTQFMSQAITPRSATNLLNIQVMGYFTNSAGPAGIVMSIFQDATASAIATSVHTMPTANYRETIPLSYTMVAGTTNSTTFKMYAGTNGGGTLTFNGAVSAREFGAVAKSSFIIREYTV